MFFFRKNLGHDLPRHIGVGCCNKISMRRRRSAYLERLAGDQLRGNRQGKLEALLGNEWNIRWRWVFSKWLAIINHQNGSFHGRTGKILCKYVILQQTPDWLPDALSHFWDGLPFAFHVSGQFGCHMLQPIAAFVPEHRYKGAPKICQAIVAWDIAHRVTCGRHVVKC